MTFTRRDFLQQGAGGLTLIASGVSVPAFLAKAALTAKPGRDNKILVVIQMTGGNDGLNTVIPFRNDIYHRLRPSLGIKQQQTLRISDELGLHPDMTAMLRLYDQGMVNIINNVGYPNPDRSHFRSMDIWHTASTQPEKVNDGWLGRLTDISENAQPFALYLDGTTLPLALKTKHTPVPSVHDISAFHLENNDKTLKQALSLPRNSQNDDLLYVQRVAVAGCNIASRMADMHKEKSVDYDYPQYALASRLKQIADLIAADFGPRVYYTSLGGFDTHANQPLVHGNLLRQLSESVASFFSDLNKRRLADRVLVMTFSEFGRRVSENASRGTDHGVAAPMFVISPQCQPGIRGGEPDLEHLLAGDIPHHVDFRSVYADILDNWLNVNHRKVLGRQFTSAGVFPESV